MTNRRQSTSILEVDLIDSVRNTTPNRHTLKAEQQVEERKKRFFDETIHLNLDEPATSWKVQRFRLTPEFVQQLIDRTVPERGVSMAYLKSSEGIIVPSDMQRSCKKAAMYDLVLSYPNRTKDVAKKHVYQGQMQFLIRDLPVYSQNHLHRVQEQHVCKWIKNGLLREDPDLVRLEKNVTSLKRSLETVIGQLQRASEEPIMNDRGLIMTGKKAELKRQERYMKLQNNRNQVRAELGETEKSMDEQHKLRADRIKLSAVLSNDKNWIVNLHGEHKSYYETILLKKSNWKTSFMYAVPKEVAGDENSQDTEYLVDTASASVERVENGFGCFNQPACYSADIESKENTFEQHVDCYHGSYAEGQRQGFGMLYATHGVYGGAFANNLHHGEGSLIYKDGDLVRSNFGLKVMGDKKGYTNRYARGLSNGHGKISFSDGAFYEGDLRNGAISGQGVYVNGSG